MVPLSLRLHNQPSEKGLPRHRIQEKGLGVKTEMLVVAELNQR